MLETSSGRTLILIKFIVLYRLDWEALTDKIMVLQEGRILFKQYIKNKPKTGKRKSTCAYSIRSLWAKLICVCVLNSFTILKRIKLTCQELFYFRIAIVHHFLEGKSFPAGHPLSKPPSVKDARRLNQQYY
ncbi:unnamed protein product [Pocillopora meandrina]|uniref:PiggyBac transposable element-derived protein domain-containing protein n=1 Tax=Pocillopora meandrina TaxID=46732 RepID=A0AAU9VQD3_9CNID|nr:unnamed protein product [Pocillopora meandrina]